MLKSMSFPLIDPNRTLNLGKDFSLVTIWLNCEAVCAKEQQTSDDLIVKDYCFIIEIFDRGHFKIIFLTIIALSFPLLRPKLEQTSGTVFLTCW